MNESIFGIIFGILIGCILILFGGFFDALLLGKPENLKNTKLSFIIVSAWETLFLIIGIIIGVFLC